MSWTGDRAFARLNYTYADVELDGDPMTTTAYCYGRPVGHIFALEVAYQVALEWRVGGNAEIALKDDDVASPLSGHVVADLYASYTPERLNGLEIHLDVQNLFDETYASRSSDGIVGTLAGKARPSLRMTDPDQGSGPCRGLMVPSMDRACPRFFLRAANIETA